MWLPDCLLSPLGGEVEEVRIRLFQSDAFVGHPFLPIRVAPGDVTAGMTFGGNLQCARAHDRAEQEELRRGPAGLFLRICTSRL